MFDDVSNEYMDARPANDSAEGQADALLQEAEAKYGKDFEALATLPAPPQATPQRQPGVVEDYSNAVLGGIRDAGQEVIKAQHALGEWFNENVFDLGTIVFTDEEGNFNPSYSSTNIKSDAPELPDVPKPVSTGAQVTKSFAQFATGFIPAVRAARAVAPLAGAARQGAAGGFVADTLAFDPHEKRLSNWLAEHSELAAPVAQFLAADPTDNRAEAMLKAGAEGLILGTAMEGFMHVMRWYRARRTVNLQQEAARPVAATAGGPDVVVDDAIKATDNATPPKPGDIPAPTSVNDLAHGVDEFTKLPEFQAWQKARTKPLIRVREEAADAYARAVQSGDLETAAAQIDFNFDRIRDADDLGKMLDKTSEMFAETFERAKRGTQSFDDTRKVAELVGSTPESLNKLYAGTKNLDAKMFAARRLMLSSTEHLKQLATIAATGNATPSQLLAFRKHASTHAAIQAQVKASQTEIARALSAMRMIADPMAGMDIDSLMAGMGGRNTSQDIARRIVSMTDDVQIAQFVRKSAYARTRDAVIEYWINAILSGPATHAVNAISNAFMIPINMGERVASAIISGGKEVSLREVQGMLVGLQMGMRESLFISSQGLRTLGEAGSEVLGAGRKAVAGDLKGAKAGLDTAKGALRDAKEEFGNVYRALGSEEAVTDPMTRVEHTHHAISGAAFNQDGVVGHAIDYLGTISRLPSRALLTSDEFFKTINYRMEMYAQAYNIASREGLTGTALKQRVADIVAEPPRWLHVESLQSSRVNTFTNELGKGGKGIQQFLANVPTARLIVPFLRTPTNLLKYVAQRTPGLHMLSETYQEAIRQGGRAADLAHARLATGGALYMSAMALATDGVITGGGPIDPDMKKQWMAAGWQPYSVKVGDKFISFRRTDPFGQVFGMVADYVDLANNVSDEEAHGMMANMMLALGRNVTSRTWLTGVTELINALSEKNPNSEKAERLLQRFGSSLIPNVLNQARVAGEDRELKEVFDFMDALKSRIPGYSKDVHPRRDIFGDPITYSGGLGPDVVSPFYMSKATDDPVRAELKRLNISFPRLPKSIGNIELSKDQYDRLAVIAGKEVRDSGNRTLHEALSAYIQSGEYARLSDGRGDLEGSKERAIKIRVSAYRRSAARKLLMDDEQLKQSFFGHKRNVLDVLRGIELNR